MASKKQAEDARDLRQEKRVARHEHGKKLRADISRKYQERNREAIAEAARREAIRKKKREDQAGLDRLERGGEDRTETPDESPEETPSEA